MPYTLPSWQDSPSTLTPLSAANLLELNTAIDDLDSRVGGSVSSVTAADSTVTVTGTTTVTVAVNAISESQVAGLPADLAGKQPLDSDLTAIAALIPANDDVVQRKGGVWTNRTTAQLKADLAVTPSDIGAVPTSRTVSAGTGLTGGGDLTANRTLTVAYGTSSTTACVGNDSRLSDSRTPTGTAGGVLKGTYPSPTLATVPFPPSTISFAATINADPTVSNNFNITATGNITSLGVSATGAGDTQMVVITVLASGGARTVTPATGTLGAQIIPSGAVGFFGFRFSSLLATPAFVCIAYQASA